MIEEEEEDYINIANRKLCELKDRKVARGLITD